jgi:voltage-gated potassium channel
VRTVEFWLAVVTVLGVLTIGILQGILVAVMLSLINVIYHISRPWRCSHMAEENGKTADDNGKIAQNEDASQSNAQPEELQNLNYEMLLIGLSLLSVLNIFIWYFSWDPVVVKIMDIINVPLTIIFLIDFVLRMRKAESKSRYFLREFGWADLAASIPLPQFKILRLFRVFRAWRMIRHYGARNLMRQISDNRADAALAVIVFSIMCVLEFGGIAMIAAERQDPNANIKTASDVIWWGYVTITTVGYGDYYPVTDAGRIVGVFVLTTGVGLFGVLTGYLANAFLAPSRKKKETEERQQAQEKQQGQEMLTASQDSQVMLAEIKAMMAEQEKRQEELRAMLAELQGGVR